MTDETQPAKTGKAADILARAHNTAPETEATAPAAVGQTEAPTRPRYQLPCAPCSIHFKSGKVVFPDGVAIPADSEQAEHLAKMAKVGNVWLLGSVTPQFSQAPR
jgi:hypothetical protein